MPFTPFHIGPGFAVGMLFKKHINLASILLASIIVDIRAIYCLFIGDCMLHGPLHTFLGGTILAIFVSLLIYTLKNPLMKMTDFLKLKQDYSSKSIITGALIGTWMHILLDAFLYFEMVPFWPIKGNFLFGIFNSPVVYNFCIMCFVAGFVVWVVENIRE